MGWGEHHGPTRSVWGGMVPEARALLVESDDCCWPSFDEACCVDGGFAGRIARASSSVRPQLATNAAFYYYGARSSLWRFPAPLSSPATGKISPLEPVSPATT